MEFLAHRFLRLFLLLAPGAGLIDKPVSCNHRPADRGLGGATFDTL